MATNWDTNGKKHSRRETQKHTATCKSKTIESNCTSAEEPKEVEKSFPAAAPDNTCSSYNTGLAPCILDVPCTERTHSRGTIVTLFYLETYKIVPGVEPIADRKHADNLAEVADNSKLEGHTAHLAE